ncbi:MAG TPA: DUF2934 domain-containing protein [Microvirga sp.]|jgi:hypothetical protein|nr:DUF2934 domain-containing protein [Microvirga sp.]
MDTLEDRIRRRAYELWEQAGRTGDPEDHWLAAERELTQREGAAEPAGQDTSPVAAVEAMEAVGDRAASSGSRPRKARGERGS